eukprot:CAMPEP_0183716980 /NCGR_PEP_ID=MMETSP0737-20130205/10705_1 /TAXON_ID=385413 /ORGANISM="Thalassiosira miniscula, Strain CCMP1093" /LENGTH=578 /DNA_ID=CAMNT_0025946321 /DNA_START=131 /DNA_END=1864 /DNA_ORIENTATION=-
MPTRYLDQTDALKNANAAAASPSKSAAKSGGASPKQKSKRKHKKRLTVDKAEPLFAFDTAREEYNWGRPKRKIKAVTRFDPTTKEKGSDCKIGHGFLCPECSAVNTYDSRECYQCHLECCYEAGVGVVVLQDRRISYKPTNKKPRVEKKKANTTDLKARQVAREKSSSRRVANNGEGNSSNDSNVPLTKQNNKGDVPFNSMNDSRQTRKKKNIFTNLKEKIKDATKETRSESQQGKGNDGMASRVEEATKEWAESTIAASKEQTYSTTTTNLPICGDNPQIPEAAAVIPQKPPSPEADIKDCQILKQQLLDLQLKYDSLFSNAIRAEEEFRATISKLEAAILERNKDAAAFSKTIASSGSKIADIKKRVLSLTMERDEFVKRVEAKGLHSVPKSIPNYSTRIDSLQTKMVQMKSDCDTAKERVKDLMSGTEVAKQEKEKASKDLEEMEAKHGETFTQCYKEIESFKQQLSDATAKISAMASEKARLVENVSSTLVHVSKVRSIAETQKNKIDELESAIKTLTLQRDAAAEERKGEMARLAAEKEEAVARTKNLEDTAEELRQQIKSLRCQILCPRHRL